MRLILPLCFLLLWPASVLPAQQPAARIKFDLERTIGEVHPHVFGNFTEHLGRVIYGGIYEPGSPLADADGFRTDVMKAVRDLRVSILRWPGGNFVSSYNWKDGVGPPEKRPVRPELAWGLTESNRFGTDEFLLYCERLGVEPYICINAGLGTINEAHEWVEYCNGDRDTYWANLRRKNGRDKPWGVKYWALGNEIDAGWQLGQKNAEDYVKFAREAAKAMRRVDSSIKLVANGIGYVFPGAKWVDWNSTVLDGLARWIDYIALHTYIGNRDNDFESFLGHSYEIERRIEVVKGMIRATQAKQANPRPIYIAYDEWNVWYRERGRDAELNGLQEIYNFEDALAMGMFLNCFLRHADIVKMANQAQLVNAVAPIFTNKQGLFLQPIYFPLAEYAKQGGNLSLDLMVAAPTYEKSGRPALPYLDVSATHNPSQGSVYLNVLNRSEGDDIEASIVNQSGAILPEIEVWELNHPDLKQTHTFGKDDIVRPKVKTFSLAAANPTFNYVFPAHSLTILKLTLRP